MSKKQTAQAEKIKKVEEPVAVKATPKAPTKPNWEIKDRMYVLKGMSPLSYHIKSSNLYYFDEEKGYEREICYSRNQRTPFVDEMNGQVLKQHICFRDGSLFVPRDKVMLQKFLSIYHPGKDKLYFEVNEKKEAEDQVDWIMVELEAMNIATSMDIETAEAVMRAELGSSVSNLSSKELKRDLLVFAKRNPILFLDLAQDDNLHLRNIGISFSTLQL